jgi:casein kinase II subunit alpha
VKRALGSGKYGVAFEGLNVLNKERCVIKALKPIKPERMNR